MKNRSNAEQGSISTEYDPNSTGSHTGSHDCIGESASSGYWSRGEKETDKDELSLRGDSLKEEKEKNSMKNLKDFKDFKDHTKINPSWNIPKQDFIVNRVEVVDGHKERKKT